MFSLWRLKLNMIRLYQRMKWILSVCGTLQVCVRGLDEAISVLVDSTHGPNSYGQKQRVVPSGMSEFRLLQTITCGVQYVQELKQRVLSNLSWGLIWEVPLRPWSDFPWLWCVFLGKWHPGSRNSGKLSLTKLAHFQFVSYCILFLPRCKFNRDNLRITFYYPNRALWENWDRIERNV